MSRRKKKNNNLKNLGLGVLAGLAGIYGYLAYVNGDFANIKLPDINIFNKPGNESRIQEETVLPENIIPVKQEEHKVKIFFIGHVDGKDVYRPVYRVNESGCSDIEFAVKSLLAGPTKYEKSKGVYSEIPPTTLISVIESTDRVAVNFSDSFGAGGGADSLYKRMYQLIKTVNYNTKKPVYLLINGRTVEALGGEGLMIKQPLNGSSLDE